MSTAATLCGFAFFLVAAPLSLPTMSFDESWETFVTYPALYAFDRPLGRF